MNDHGEISKKPFCIGEFTIKPSRNILVKDGKTYSLEPRVMDVLCALAAQSREVIPRDTIIENVWNVEFGADESLTRAISLLRKTFKGAGETNDFIQTIPKRGYRLAVDVTEAQIEPNSPPTPQKEAVQVTPKQKESQPTKMVAADISGFVPPAPAEKSISAPALQPTEINQAVLPVSSEKIPDAIIQKSGNSKVSNSKKFFLGLGLLFSIIIAFYFSGMRFGTKDLDREQFGNSLSVAEYGRSIAVLSLIDMSPKSDLEYFADGTAEEILSTLTHVPDLRVAGRASSFAYKGKNANIHEIGTELRVSHIIDGSVRRQNQRVKITIRLNSVADGAQIWSKSYTGTLDNTFSLQEEISQDLLINLKLLLGINLNQVIKIEPLKIP